MAEPADDKHRDKLAPIGAIFVGMVAAKNLAKAGDDRPLKAMQQAEKLRRAGAEESKIYAETNKGLEGSPYAGVSYGADRKPRFEISDHDAKLSPAALDKSGKGHMGNFVKHDAYYKAHPDAAMLEVERSAGRGGSFDGAKVTIGDNHFAAKQLLGRPLAKPTARGVALHEKQHHAQGVEGFAPGGSPNDFKNRVDKAEMREALYNSLAGEVEAENTRKRADLTPAERRAIHPARTASIPRSEQIVTDQHGRVQETKASDHLWGRLLQRSKASLAREERVAGALAASVDKPGLRMVGKKGSVTSLLTHSSDKPGHVRITNFVSGEPSGHSDYKATPEGFKRAAADFVRDGGRLPKPNGRIQEMAEDIKDFGQKIGGARKDIAKKGLSRPKSEAPAGPAYERQYIAMESRHRPGEWHLFKAPSGRGGGSVGSRVGGPFPSESIANAAKPLAAVSQTFFASGKATGEYAIWRRSTKGSKEALPGVTFKTQAEAHAYMANNVDALLSQKTPKGYGEALLREVKVTHTKRVGPEVAKGEVTPEQFMKTFNPRGVEFGHWEEGARRGKLLAASYEALHDLARATGLHPSQLTMGGQLGISFGARGTGGMNAGSATYHPDYGTMNFTKPHGAGALAHEYMHALDHLLARLDNPALDQKMTNHRGDQVWKTAGDASFGSNRVVGMARERQLNSEVRSALSDLMTTMTKKVVTEVEATDKIGKAAEYSLNNVRKILDDTRRGLTETITYRSRNNQPATPEQLARFDQHAQALLAGEGGKMPYKSVAIGRRPAGEIPYEHPHLRGIAEVMKEVRGRTGFGDHYGSLDYVASGVRSVQDLKAREAEAKAGVGKSREVATDFYREARRLDQTRTTAYWTERHEMFARAGEAWVHDKLTSKGEHSPYLVAGTKNSFEAAKAALSGRMGDEAPKPFPEGAERAAINAKFDRLFEAMRAAEVVKPAPGFTLPTPARTSMATDFESGMKAANEAAAARVTIDGKGPAGWSDEARAKSAEVRAADAKPTLRPAKVQKRDIPAGMDKAAKLEKHSVYHAGKNAGHVVVERVGDQMRIHPKLKPEFQRQGLGTKLYDTFAEQAKADGRRLVPSETLSESALATWRKRDPSAVSDYKVSAEVEKVLGERVATRNGSAEPVIKAVGEVMGVKSPKARTAAIGDNGGPSDKALKTAAKLEAVAKRTIAEAQAVHDQPRLMNTARRASMGSGVMEEQQRRIANAKTALKIAEALRNGEAGALIKVESLADVERVSNAYRSAMYANDQKRKEYRGSMTGVEPEVGDIKHAKPVHTSVRGHIFASDIEGMKKALAGKGVTREMARLEKAANRPDGWRLTDPKDIEALAKVAKAVKTLDPKDTSWAKYKHDARHLQSNANQWLGELREYEANKRLGLNSTAELHTTLEAFAQARVNRPKADPVAAAERDLIGRKLPGFFPTPTSLADRMAQMADIKPGMQVLEPSAGTGRLADAAKKLGAEVHAVEMQSSLRDILLKKGHNVVDHDFTAMKREPSYDRIVMNPPFEKGQDIAHVRQAYDMLKPGGRIVAIMGEGAFFRGDAKASEFRNWLETVGTSEKLPEGTFKESNTGVNTRLVTIEKPAASAAGHNRPPFIQGEVLSSQFVNYLAETKGKMPKAEWESIRKEGRGRIEERLKAGRADSVLDFRDLVSRGESAIAGAKIESNGPQGWSDAARKASAEVRTIGDNAPKGVVQEIRPAATSGHTSIRLKIGNQEWSTAFRNDHPEGMLKHNIGSLRETYRKELASRFNEAVARGDTLDLKSVTLKTFAGSGQALDKVTLKPDHANALDASRETTKGHGKRAWTAKAYGPDKLSFFGEEIPLASKQAGVIAKALGMPAFSDVVAEIDTAVKGENRGWSDAARTASAVARAENAKPKPAPSVQSAVDRAMAMQEAKAKAAQPSTLGQSVQAKPTYVKTASGHRVEIPGASLALRPIPGDAKTLSLQSFVVDDGKRGKGLGSALISKVTADADKNGQRLKLNAVAMDAGDGKGLNQKALESFYQRHGFKPDADGSMVREPARNPSHERILSGIPSAEKAVLVEAGIIGKDGKAFTDKGASFVGALKDNAAPAKPAYPAAQVNKLFDQIEKTKPATREAARAEFMAKAEVKVEGGQHFVKPPGATEWVKTASGNPTAAKAVVFANTAGKTFNKLGTVAMIVAPVAAAAVAYDATKSQANAAGVTGKAATASAVKSAAVAGTVTAGFGLGIAKGIHLGFKGIAAVAPKLAPVLGPAGIVLGAGMMAHGAYKGYQSHGIKGAALGLVGAEGILDIGKSKPAASPASLSGSNGRLSTEQVSHFQSQNAAYKASHATGPVVVEQFDRQRRTQSGMVITETVTTHTRKRAAS